MSMQTIEHLVHKLLGIITKFLVGFIKIPVLPLTSTQYLMSQRTPFISLEGSRHATGKTLFIKVL